MKILGVVLALLIISFIGVVLFLSKDDFNANFENIDTIIQSSYDAKKMAGFSMAVFNGDSVFYSKSFGYADLDRRINYTDQTTQFIASISKTTIGLSLLKAEELGLLNIDDPISNHLPFEIFNPEYPQIEITIRQLATHTSSLDYNEAVVESLYIPDELKEASLGHFMFDYFKRENYGPVTFSNYPPGAHWNYSNIGSALAAYIIEYKSGITFDKFTRKYIFEPLEMNHTAWFKKNLAFENVISYYAANDANELKKGKDQGVVLYPARDLMTTIGDLTKYCQAIIKRDTKLLSAPSFEEMLSPKLSKRVVDQEVDNQGLFWFIDRNQYGIFYQLTGHGGGDEGINSMMWYNPKTELGYIFLGNTSFSKNNRRNHIIVMQSMASLGEHVLKENPKNTLKKSIAYRWGNLSNRIWSAILAIAG